MPPTKVVILYNEADQDSSVADQDVIVQRDAVRTALDEVGCQVRILPCTLNLQHTADSLRRIQPDVVFNLVESLGGTDRLMPAVTMLLDAMKVSYTGASTQTILQTSNKITAKQQMHSAGLPTPQWWTAAVIDAAAATFGPPEESTEPRPTLPRRAIVKPVWEHASLGMGDESVVTLDDEGPLRNLIRTRTLSTGRLHFAEEFIDGREFNLSVMEDNNGTVTVLPAAEIDFSAYPDHKPRIVGHNAKWCEDTFEYQQTPRRFDFPPEDQPLLEWLRNLTKKCWNIFHLRGYARVDFRVDRNGMPWILEINVNPCLSPDAGFAAALNQAGISFSSAIHRITLSALNRDLNNE